MVEKNKQSVAIIVCAWPPNGGGIGNNAYYQARELAAVGYRVGVFTPAFSGILQQDYQFEFRPLKTFPHIGKAGPMFSLLRRLKGFEIIHLYYPFFGSDLLVILYKLLHPKAKLVIHYQMDPVATGLKGLIFWLHLKLFLGPLIAVTDKVGVLSFDHAQNSYLRKYLDRRREKFFELPNGVDIVSFSPREKNESLMKLYNFSVQDKIILFVGGLDRQHYFKGLPVLFEAYKKININFFPDIRGKEALRGNLTDIKGEAKILVIGDGELKREFVDLARELKIEKNVIFAGWVDNSALPDYYSLADVLVLPSTARIESFGIVAAEAQSCGVPVIVSNWPGVRATLENNRTGLLVEPGNSDDLCEKIKTILNNPQLAKDFGRAGRDRAVANYSWPRIIKIIEDVYGGL